MPRAVRRLQSCIVDAHSRSIRGVTGCESSDTRTSSSNRFRISGSIALPLRSAKISHCHAGGKSRRTSLGKFTCGRDLLKRLHALGRRRRDPVDLSLNLPAERAHRRPRQWWEVCQKRIPLGSSGSAVARRQLCVGQPQFLDLQLRQVLPPLHLDELAVGQTQHPALRQLGQIFFLGTLNEGLQVSVLDLRSAKSVFLRKAPHCRVGPHVPTRIPDPGEDQLVVRV